MSEKTYEQKPENFEEIPLPSRRSQEERDILEYFRLREEVEQAYKTIRTKKRRIEELIGGSSAIATADKRMKKVPKELEEERILKKQKRTPKSLTKLENEKEKEQKKKFKNAKKKKIDSWRSYLQQGYTMTEGEISKEGGEEYVNQYVFFKELGDGKSSTHVMRGMKGLKLSSQLGNDSPQKMETNL
jgi:hypothetical protein